MDLKIRVDDLELIISKLLHKMRESQGNQIVINSDYYWSIPSNELYDPYKTPNNLTMGQLADEISEINRLLKTDDVVPYDLGRMAVILKVLSVENPIAF